MVLSKVQRGGFPVYQCVVNPAPRTTWLERMPWIFVLIAVGVAVALLAGTWWVKGLSGKGITVSLEWLLKMGQGLSGKGGRYRSIPLECVRLRRGTTLYWI